MNRLLLAASLFASSALAGPYDQVYSILTTDTARAADPHLRPVFVNRVDGETQMSDNKAVVAPGKRHVTVDLPPRKGFKQPTQNTFELDVKPCTRYNLAAKLDSQVTQGWTPIVRSTEPIGECEAKFKVAGAR